MPTTYRGVNLAGLEFNETVLPGVLGVDYYPPTTQEVDYFIGKRMNVFRLPFLWERLQPTAQGPFDAPYLQLVQDFVTYATAAPRNASVVLDLHNYGKYRGVEVTANPAANAGFIDVWTRLANLFKTNPRVIFGLMNEPGLVTRPWAALVQQVVTAIRNAGATNLILSHGGWTISADNWMSAPDINYDINADYFAANPIVDPANNFAFEVHQYFDADGSGTSPICQPWSIFTPYLTTPPYDLQAWARANNVKFWLGECGFSSQAQCLDTANNGMWALMDANPDVWLGWTYWAAGPAWGPYMFSLEPIGCPACVDAPQMAALLPHLP